MSGLMQCSKTVCHRRPATLLDNLVGAAQERLRDGEAERFGGLDVDSHLKLGLTSSPALANSGWSMNLAFTLYPEYAQLLPATNRAILRALSCCQPAVRHVAK
jgi:hypothetical protein